MLASFLMGLVGGQRAMTPLATVAVAAARGEVPADGIAAILKRPAVVMGTLALAAGELTGDKMKSAPDRIVPVGLTARFITSAIAGAVVAPRRQRALGAAVGGLTAVVAAFPGWRARMAVLPRFGQTATGIVEDAAVLAGAAAIVRGVGVRRLGRAAA